MAAVGSAKPAFGLTPALRAPAMLLPAVLLLPVLGRVAPGLLTQFNALMLAFGVCYAMAVLPLNLLMGYAGQISLGHAAFLGLGAFAHALLAGQAGLPFVVSLVGVAALGAVVSMAIGLPALRLRGLYLALVTLGFGLAMSEVVFLNSSVTGGKAGLAVPRPLAGTFEFSRNADLLALLVLLAAALWWVDRNVVSTQVGRTFQALRQDEDVAASLGVDVARHKLLAFVLYGSMSAIAGAALAQVIGIAQAETFTFDFSLLFVIVVIVGGLGSRAGVMVAAFLLAIVPRFFLALEGWDLVLGPLGLAVAIVRHPGGLAQIGREAMVRRRAPRASGVRPPATDDDAALVIQMPTPLRQPLARGGSHPLRVEGVSVRFGGLQAVADMTLRAERGRITGLIGPNGAGKTTLFNVVSGLIRPDSGRVLLDGTDVTGLPPHRRAALGLGRTFQQGGLIKDLSVRDNLLLAQHVLVRYRPAAALARMPAVAREESELARHADEVLAALRFERHGHTRLGDLSHGQQRIVELAAVLLTGPSVLLLDEPSAGMSPAAAEALAERLIHVRDDLGQTIVLIEHHLPLVMATCDHVAVMDAGTLLVEGPPDVVRRDPAVVTAYLGGSSA